MTKAFTTSMIGMLVEEGLLSFSTQLQEIFPEFQRQDAQANITLEDLMSHRTGLAPMDNLWFSSFNEILVDRSQAIPILSYAPVAGPLRASFNYNNIAYEVLGQVLEKVTGLSYLDLLHQRIIDPLRLNRTFYAGEPLDENTAKSYAALVDGSFHELPPWGYGDNLFIGAGGAVRSSVNDLLFLYKALMDAANSQVWTATATNPFKQAPALFEGKIGVGSTSLREYSYASGWIRAQLPAMVHLFADYWPPVLLEGGESRLMIHHQGYIMGNAGIVSLFPETSTAIVVLGNSAGLTDAMRLFGQVLVETTFGNKFNTTTYTNLAREARDYFVQYVEDRNKELIANKTAQESTNPLLAYVGKYHNSIGSFFIEIKLNGGKLQASFLGADVDTYDLQPYQTNSFFWILDFDESAKRARLPWFPAEYFVLKFGCQSEPSWWQFGKETDMRCLTWKHEFTVPGEGEIFRKESGNHKVAGFSQHSGSQGPVDL
ncbi:beta-lactamase/transpeptidase-like protein [Nemania sp. FL0031]|nr:beta-lactamase/transpeptidase-like protein [Nemania sp. FL0031]